MGASHASAYHRSKVRDRWHHESARQRQQERFRPNIGLPLYEVSSALKGDDAVSIDIGPARRR
jgi:hypothetical protein